MTFFDTVRGGNCELIKIFLNEGVDVNEENVVRIID
jgi:hypothetical protein